MQPLQGWPLGITLGIGLVLALRFGPIRALVFMGLMVVIQQLNGLQAGG
jgi:hypothetical protein